MFKLLSLEGEIWYANYPDLNLQLCARVVIGSCPGVRMYYIRLSILKIFV